MCHCLSICLFLLVSFLPFLLCPFVLMIPIPFSDLDAISLSHLVPIFFIKSRSKYIKAPSFLAKPLSPSVCHCLYITVCISMPSLCLFGPIFLSLSLTFRFCFPSQSTSLCTWLPFTISLYLFSTPTSSLMSLYFCISNFDSKSLSQTPYLFLLSLSSFLPFFVSQPLSLSLCFSQCLYICP